MNANRPTQVLLHEAPSAETAERERLRDPLTSLMQEIAADARERAARYPRETRVPEGGE